MKTFKEQLTEQANNQTYDISDHVKRIKNMMRACINNREFVISLIHSKPDSSIIALGYEPGPVYQTFIPCGCAPHVYMKLFIVALKELGFKDEDIEKGAGEEKDYYYYNIKVKW
jgi:hypothetical protein